MVDIDPFLNTVPIDDVITIVIASAPAAPVSPFAETLYALLPSLYVTSVQRYGLLVVVATGEVAVNDVGFVVAELPIAYFIDDTVTLVPFCPF